jgi:hypothetical protein
MLVSRGMTRDIYNNAAGCVIVVAMESGSPRGEELDEPHGSTLATKPRGHLKIKYRAAPLSMLESLERGICGTTAGGRKVKSVLILGVSYDVINHGRTQSDILRFFQKLHLLHEFRSDAHTLKTLRGPCAQLHHYHIHLSPLSRHITGQRTAHLLHARGGLGFFTEQLLEQRIHTRPGQMAATQCLLYGL